MSGTMSRALSWLELSWITLVKSKLMGHGSSFREATSRSSVRHMAWWRRLGAPAPPLPCARFSRAPAPSPSGLLRSGTSSNLGVAGAAGIV